MSTTKIATSFPIAMSSNPSPTSGPRASRFTEGSPLTGDEVLSQDSSSNMLLHTILSEMDDHERRRQRSHRNSNSSTDSFASASSSSNNFSPARESRRSITFNKRSVELVRTSLDEMRNGGGSSTSSNNNSNGEEKSRGGGFKGRLRALTGGRERSGSVKAYTGT